MWKILERLLLKIWYIKITKAKNIAETFTLYMIEDMQNLIEKDLWLKKDPTYKKEMLKFLNKTFEVWLKVDNINYELEWRDYTVFWYNN